MKEPLILGHESGGVVTAVGSAVDGLQVGDHVALEVGVPCDDCASCASGRYNLCSQMRFRSSAKIFPHFQGTLQERLNHPAKWCWKLPSDLTLDHAALIEPLSVALHALKRALIPSEPIDVLVLGAGAVGALTAAALRLRHPEARVVVADVNEGRLQFATANNFAHDSCMLPMKRGSTTDENLAVAKSNAELLRECIGSREYHVIFECTGQEICLQSAIYAAKAGGKVLMIGMGTPIQTLPISAAALREVDLLGVFRYADTYPSCIEMLQKAAKEIKAGGLVPDVTRLITHRVHGLEDASKAFELAGRPVDEQGSMVLKVVIEQ
jgi:L-iditol 2-dehydrogenase